MQQEKLLNVSYLQRGKSQQLVWNEEGGGSAFLSQEDSTEPNSVNFYYVSSAAHSVILTDSRSKRLQNMWRCKRLNCVMEG